MLKQLIFYTDSYIVLTPFNIVISDQLGHFNREP